MRNQQNKQNTGKPSASARGTGSSGKQTGKSASGTGARKNTGASRADDGRVRLSAAERFGKQPDKRGATDEKKNNRAGDDRQVVRRAVRKDTGAKGQEAAKNPPAPAKKEYDPRSSAPIHQVLPFVFLILGLFFAVCFILYAVNKDHAEEVIGTVGRGICRVLFGVLGYGAFTLPVVFFSLGFLWRRSVDNGSLGLRLGLTFLFSVLLSAFLHIVIVLRPMETLPGYDIGALYREGALIGGGGVVGGIIGRALYTALRLAGSSILCVGGLLLLGMFLCGVTPVYVWTSIRYRARRNRERREAAKATREEIRENQKLADAVLSGGLDTDPENGKRKRSARAGQAAEENVPGKDETATASESTGAKKGRSAFRMDYADDPEGAGEPDGKTEKPRRRKAREDTEILPVMTDESIPHEKEKDDLDDIPGLTELDMSAVYGNPAMREEMRRSDEVNSAAKENGFTATDWMRSTPDGFGSDDSASQTFAEASKAALAEDAPTAKPADAAPAGNVPVPVEEQKPEDERIQQLFAAAQEASEGTVPAPAPATSASVSVPTPAKKLRNDIPIKENGSEAEEYLPVDEETGEVLSAEPTEHPYVFPPVDLLKQGDSTVRITKEEVERNMQTLRSVLKSFNINIKEMAYSCGPTITRYEVRPESGTRVRQFTLLSDDIALGLAAKSGIRIEAPIPGKPAVGIEVPNDNPATVWLRSLIDTPEFTSSKGILPVCLGADISGKEVFLDIVKMPHLLIAGATGMGKSVCINCLVTSLMYRYSPADVRLIMVDPKQVEFVPYKDIPHLFVPIITDPKAATAALSAAIDEMEDRFTKIKDMGVRDIRGYNDIAAMDPEVEKMPYIVIIIDELADLMMTASDEVETSICRLAQKARAAGIHLIIGTQRPSVDVVKGTIKSNIPSRIAFTVASQVDSKTILDAAGAEKLIGRGDMIYAPVGAMKPIRVQGAFVSDKEVESISDFIKKNNDPVKYDEQFMKRMTEAAARVGAKKNEGLETDGESAYQTGDDDDKLRAALEIIYDTGRASTSLLQRKLSIGYGRAAKILDALEEQGFIGPQEGSKPRTILISRQEYMERYLNDTVLSSGDGGDGGED